MTTLPINKARYRGALASIAALAIAALQLTFFLPTVNAGRAVDFGPYRADGVALIYGTAWALAFALAASMLSSRRQAASLLLTLLGLLSVAYSREPFLLYLGWELATAGLWLASDHKPRFGRLSAALHVAGLPFLMAILLGLVAPFAPPQGGVAAPWHVAITAMMVTVLLMRAWLAGLIARNTQTSPLYRLYAMAAPILLVKALVAAPFDPFGIWLLALLGAAMLPLGAYTALFLRSPTQAQASVYVWIGSIVAALGLATGTPLAAAGAVWLMLSGSFLAATMWDIRITNYKLRIGVGTRRTVGVVLTLALPGIWLIAQGALDQRYGLVAALLLPCLAVALIGQASNKGIDQAAAQVSHKTSTAFLSLMAVLALALAVYPQLPVEFTVRPAVQAMAGGVRALSTVAVDWGVGVMVRPTQASLSAGLPATGMMLALFLAFVTLYWLKRLARRFSRQATESEAG